MDGLITTWIRKHEELSWGENFERTRRCYAPLGAVKNIVLTNKKVLDPLMDVVGVRGKPAVNKKRPDKEKLDAILSEIERHRADKNSQYFDMRCTEILVLALWRSKLSNKLVMGDLLSDVRRESDLCEPVLGWVRSRDFEAHVEVPMGKKRTDVLGYKPAKLGGLWGPTIVAIELKNDLKEFERAIDQMTTYREYAHQVYLAATPSMCVDYIDTHYESRGVKRHDAGILDRKLKSVGCGLMLVERSGVTILTEPPSNSVTKEKVQEVIGLLSHKTRR